MALPRLTDLGWHNSDMCRPAIDATLKVCRALGHQTTDQDLDWPTGADHIVKCESCGYIYHYDSSD